MYVPDDTDKLAAKLHQLMMEKKGKRGDTYVSALAEIADEVLHGPNDRVQRQQELLQNWSGQAKSWQAIADRRFFIGNAIVLVNVKGSRHDNGSIPNNAKFSPLVTYSFFHVNADDTVEWLGWWKGQASELKDMGGWFLVERRLMNIDPLAVSEFR